MKKTISFIIISFFTLFTASAQNLYIGSFYVTTTEEETLYGDGGDKWATRLPIICDMFNFEQPDVLGLQSLTSSQLSAVSKRLTNHDAAGNILYNKNTIELDTCGVVEDMPEGSTCSWAKLRKDETIFYVFNVCFSTETSVATTSATRVNSAVTAINTEKLPCFVVGDLGVNETKTAYTRLSSRYNDCYTKAAVVSAEYGTKNDFDLAANHGTDRYDFIFAPKTATVKAYGQLQYGYFTKESDGSYKRRLPSTHFPVMAKVTLP
jgi:endonuclease/exonuclease/phosphatase family metal-dependent hydrolase